MTDTTPITNDTPFEDDPNLTAFALGELDPASDVYKQIADRLEHDADAAALVEQIRALGSQLTHSYAGASPAGLSDHQQQELDAMIDQQPQPTETTASNHEPAGHIFRMPRKVLLAAGLALAATAAITTVSLMGPNDRGSETGTGETAQDNTQPPAVTGYASVSQAINTPVAVDFEQAPLSAVLGFLHKQTGVGIKTDWEALATRGVGPETPVSLTAESPQPAGTVLSVALQLAHAQSPHPDPPQWAMSDAGIAISPKSKLVQDRLDATARLLEARRFSKAPVDERLLTTASAEVWETSLWNDMLRQRDVVGQKVLAEASASLDAAEKAAAKDELDAASEHGLYAYTLLATHAALLQGDQFTAPLQRIAELQETIRTAQLRLDKAAVTQAVAQAQANDTELDAYESAMQVAIEALENGSFQSANDAIIEARTVLTQNQDQYDPTGYAERTLRAARLQDEIRMTREREMALQVAQAELAAKQQEATAAEEIEQQRASEIQSRLRAARELQQQGRYAEARDQVEAAQFLEPDNPVLKGFNDLLKDSEAAVQSGQLQRLRQREVQQLNHALSSTEASTPNADILTYPGDWPELTAVRLEGLEAGAAGGPTVVDSRGVVTFSLNLPMDSAAPTAPSLNAGRGDYRNTLKKMKANSGPVSRFNLGGVGSRTTSGGVLNGKAGNWSGSTVWNDNHVGYERDADFQTRYADHTLDDFESVGRPELKLQTEQRELRRNGGAGGGGAGSGDTWAFARPQAETSRRQVIAKELDALINRPAPAVDPVVDPEPAAPDDPQAATEAQRERAELAEKREAALQQRLERAAVLEPFELDRIAAIQQLQELEQQFIEGCLEAEEDEPVMDRDAFALVNDNPFYNPADAGRTLSTFSVDVDTAAYSLIRRQLVQQNRMPVPNAVRIEEMLNYFDYDYDAPVIDAKALDAGVVTQASLEKFEQENEGFAPFATHVQVTDCPWQAGHKLVRIGIEGMDVKQEDRPQAHLTFLLDVSGSMNNANKLPLVKESIKLLLDKLNKDDHVSLVVYAGASGLVLENASAADKAEIEAALDRLKAGGSTAGAEGIQLAYQVAQRNFIDGGVNRVILCTDGDFNVGISDTDDLVALIKDKANPPADADGKRRGVYLSVMGYGMGNLNDAMMEPLTNAGNGTYAYIDTKEEATKVMYDQAGSTLVTIAKDVKVQVQFDPEQVMAYRLIGYENRVLVNKDFANDKVDAGDIGAGHSVTALYEVVPFDPDLGDDEAALQEVKRQIEQLDEAIALNESLMQTAALTPNQRIKLGGSTRLLKQERVLADAAAKKLSGQSKHVVLKPGSATKPMVPVDPVQPAEPAPVDPVDEPVAGQPAVEAPAEVEAEAEPVVEPLEDGAMLAVRLRYKPVDAPAEDGTSRLIETSVFAQDAVAFDQADESTRFAAAVAGFGMVLRSSPHKGDADLGWVLNTALGAMDNDPGQLRGEFIELVEKAVNLMPKPEGAQPEVIR